MNIPEIVQQGGCWGPMECSVAIDNVGKVVESRGPSLYKYKGLVNIIPLAMVDDLLGIAPCGIKSIELNTLINTQIEMKRLRFHTLMRQEKQNVTKSMWEKETIFAQS